MLSKVQCSNGLNALRGALAKLANGNRPALTQRQGAVRHLTRQFPHEDYPDSIPHLEKHGPKRNNQSHNARHGSTGAWGPGSG